MLSVAGVGMCALVCLLTVRETRREWEPYVLLGVSVLFFALLLPGVRETAGFLASLTEAGTGISVILKALGISWMTAAAADLCRASGEPSLAGYLEAAGRVELTLLALPLLRDLLVLAGGAL